MKDKELYVQKKDAQLKQWKADLEKIKAKASNAGADAQLQVNKQVKALEVKLDQGKDRLAAMADAGGDAWESLKKGVESEWDDIKSKLDDAASKLSK
jgi:hypothetical protein